MRSLTKNVDDTHLSAIKLSKSDLLYMIHIIDAWTKQKHYPTLNITRNYLHASIKIDVLIENYNASNRYCIPVTYTVQTSLNFDTLSPYFVNETKSFHLYLGLKQDGWVIFNLQQIGKY